MAQQLVILVGHDQWRVVHCKGWRYLALNTFSTDTENQALLLDKLKQYAGASVYFLTDIADEQYHVEVLPHVSGAARKQLLARRLAAWPFAQGLHTLNKVGSVQNVRKEDRYLFSAIHYPPLREWLQGLQLHSLRVQGIYTQALCTPCWTSHLQARHAQCLIVYLENRQLRIRYLYRSRLLFSRLITLAPEAPTGTRISSEIAQTRSYMVSQKWLQENETLHLLWFSEDAQSNDLPSDLLPLDISHTFISYEDLMRQSGWQLIPEGLSVIDWAALQAIRNTRLPNFAPEASLMNARVLKGKRMIVAASVSMLCIGGVAHLGSQQSLLKTQFNIRQTNAELKRWQSAMPALGIAEAELPRLQTFSRVVQRLETSVRFPDRALTMLQAVMMGQPVWQVQALDWGDGLTSGTDGLANKHLAHEQSGQPDSHSETLTIRFARQKAASSPEAHQSWQSLLEKLRQHPDVLEVTEMNTSAQSESPVQKGDTRQSLLPEHQPTLTIKLRALQRVAT